MDKVAYPQTSFCRSPKDPYDLEKWKKMSLKVGMALREYTEYPVDEVVDHFTRDWDYHERDSFKHWLDFNQKYKKGQKNMTMEKVAYDFASPQKEERLNELKKKLRSRINSADRLLNKMIDEGLLSGSEEKVLYIGRILQKLKEEINLLKRPQLLEARLKRAGNLIKKAGFVEVAQLVFDGQSLTGWMEWFDREVPWKTLKKVSRLEVKQAQTEGIREVLMSIKEELDTFNYGVHLRKLMDIANRLDKLGYHSEYGMVVDIIKKELDGLDSIHKKLVEVYTSISQVPAERPQRAPQSRVAPAAPERGPMAV